MKPMRKPSRPPGFYQAIGRLSGEARKRRIGDVSADPIRKLLNYDPATGLFTWRVTAGSKAMAGSIAGSIGWQGYRAITLSGRRYRAHRLAWFYVYGRWPNEEVDHVNGLRDDNRIANLRESTRSLNSQNQRRAQSQNRSSGLLGVSRARGRRKWRAAITVNGRCRVLGQFDTPELAHAAYLTAKRGLHEGCTI